MLTSCQWIGRICPFHMVFTTTTSNEPQQQQRLRQQQRTTKNNSLMTQLAGQKEFDFFVQELLQEGHEWPSAVQEALDTMNDSSYDTSGLFVYQSKSEFEEKQKAEKRITTISSCAQGSESFVNVNFSLQGLSQTLTGSNHANALGTVRLAESKRLFHSLYKILSNMSTENDEDNEDAIGEDDDSDEDPEAEKSLQLTRTLEFTLLFISKCREMGRNFAESITLDSVEVVEMKKILDANSDDDDVIPLVLDMLLILLQVPLNRDLIKEVGLIAELSMIKKLHNKSTVINSKADSCLAFF